MPGTFSCRRRILLASATPAFQPVLELVVLLAPIGNILRALTDRVDLVDRLQGVPLVVVEGHLLAFMAMAEGVTFLV